MCDCKRNLFATYHLICKKHIEYHIPVICLYLLSEVLNLTENDTRVVSGEKGTLWIEYLTENDMRVVSGEKGTLWIEYLTENNTRLVS